MVGGITDGGWRPEHECLMFGRNRGFSRLGNEIVAKSLLPSGDLYASLPWLWVLRSEFRVSEGFSAKPSLYALQC